MLFILPDILDYDDYIIVHIDHLLLWCLFMPMRDWLFLPPEESTLFSWMILWASPTRNPNITRKIDPICNETGFMTQKKANRKLLCNQVRIKQFSFKNATAMPQRPVVPNYNWRWDSINPVIIAKRYCGQGRIPNEPKCTKFTQYFTLLLKIRTINLKSDCWT